MLKAGPAAKAMGIDPRGKRLAQVVAEIDAADAQRAGVRQDGADLAAGQIDREWSAFAPETGTLGVPRAEMPQIKAEHRGALVNFLKARGIDSRADEVPANDLKPSQAEFSPAKVKKARAFQGGDRSILVSSDGYVVDGHHQWLAKRANGEPVKVIRLQAPIREVLAQTAEFPSTASGRGAQLKPGGTDAATPRDLRPADERAPGAAAPASDRAGPTAGSAAPAVGAGQREGGDTAQPAPAVRAAVPDAGGSGQRAADVAPAAPSQSANSRAASEKLRDDYRAAEAKRTAPGARARSAAADANPFKAFIAKHGIALDQRREFAPGTAEQRQAMVPGYGPIFRRTGKPLDLLAQSAVDEGFLVSPDAAALHDLIGRALRGERIVAQYTADAAEVEMQSRVARQREMEEDAATAVAALSDPSLFDLNDDDIVLTADSNTSTEEAMRSLGFTEQEIQDVIAQESAGTPEGSARSGGADETDARPAQGSAGQGTQEARPQRVARQDLLGDAPNESQQAAARERARRQQQDGAQRNAAPGPKDFTLGMVDANTGREVAPGQPAGGVVGEGADRPAKTATGDDGRARFTVSIPVFGDVPYRASAPVDAGDGHVVSSRVITTRTKLTAANAQSLGLPKDKGTVYAWRVSVIRRADGDAHSVIEAMAADHGRSPDGEVLARFKPVENAESVGRIAPAVAKVAMMDWEAAALDGKAQAATRSAANSNAPGPSTPGAAAPRPAARIDDFGETLHGARKMLYAEAYADGMTKAKKLDTKAHPLSKTWPEPDYQKLLEGGAPVEAVSMARALREAVPTKPQSSWKLKGWAAKVEALRGFAEDVLSGRLDIKTVEGSMERSGLRGVPNKAALYEAMGHERSMKGIDVSVGRYSMYDRVEYNPPRTIWTVSREAKGSSFGNWPRELAKGDTREAAIAAFKKRSAELLAEEQAPTKGATFEIYGKRAGGAREFFIGKKIGRNVAELKTGFADLKAARQYKTDHQSELEDLLAKYKAVPPVRNTQNAPRIGEDYRKGADVTPERFQEAFGFRGVQFGNYVEGGRRQQDLNRAYDALMDLAGVLGLPPRALSLGGRLGLAFGARGTGGTDAAAAHYEPDTVVINLTKREGAGSMAHEWWHALDNYFSRQRGDGGSYMTSDSRSGDGVREEMRAAFRAVMSAINLTGMQERSRKLDDRRTKEYWTTKPEMSARAFESYVIAKLQDQNAGNDYLANVVGDAVFALEGAYPYPTAGELPQIRSAFDTFFQTVETRQGEGGETVLFSRSPATTSTYEARIDALFSGEKPRLQGARVLDRSDMLAFLGLGDGPVNLAEGKVTAGQNNHPHMTASIWKKIPEWLENPALVFDSDTAAGRLVFIAPELVNGSPVRIIVEPNAGGGVKAHLLVNAYDAQGNSFRRWEQDGLLRYVDRNKYAHVSGTFQPRLAGLPGDRGRASIVTDKQYNGWRRANNAAYSQEMSPELASALLAIRRPATKESVRAAVRELVNGIGMLPNRLGRVVVATAAEIKQEWEPLIGDVSMDAEGEAGKALGFYDPNTKTVFLIADNIRAGDELGVVAHELMHKHGQAVLGDEGWNRLHGSIEGWASAAEGSLERQVYDEAAARVQASGPELSTQELFPYAVQVALEQGIRPNLLAKPGTVARWLGQVKAALRQVWTKIVGKPESFNAQDLVNLAFGIAQRENPVHAGELDGVAVGAPEDRVGSTLLELGRDERLYQYPKSDSKDIVQIGAAKDLTVGPVDRNASESDEWMLANTTPQDGDGVQSWMVRLPNGKSATITDNNGQVYINVSAVGEGGGGSRVYDLAANYALNNGAVFVGDPNGVSASAMRRRLENMLSSAIKYGTTDHLAPHPDQVAGRDGVAPLEWTPGDTLGNIESMVKASVAATEATNPLATSYVRYEPQTRSFDIDPDYGGRSGQVAQDLSDLLDFDGRTVGMGQGGRRTVQRAVFFHSLLSGVGGRLRVLERFRNEQGHGSQGTAASEEGPTDRGIFYSRSVAAAPVAGDYTPAQQRAAEHAFGVQKQQTIAERAQAFRANLGARLRQGLVDQFAPIKEVSQHAYMLARMSKGSDAAVEAALLYGKPFLRDGVYDVDINDGGFAQVLASLKGEHDRFFQWVAAQRAERLKAEGKENLLTDQDITALRTLNAGTMADGAARMPVYTAALRELNAFNEATLKVAMESGLIDQTAFDLMKDQPYVPFYRLMEEDGGMRGPRFSSGLVNQQAWKKLKGGTQQINADLVQNTLLNWSHLYGAAARNRASLETMAAAEKMGIAYQVPAETKGAVKVMREGVAEHWAVEDPYLLDAISAMSYAPGGIVKAMAPFKRLLTFGVTVNPTFKIRNLIRDSLSAIAQSELSYNPLENVAKGWTATSKESQTYASMLASGGIIKFGTQEDSGRVRILIEKFGGQVLDQDGWSKLKSQMRSLWETYEEFGDRTENVNRAALYERLIAKGHSHAEASFMARDLMDFSMSGKWEVVRFLTQTVPFLNARMQGLYKLGRAAKEDPRRFAAMAGAVSLASLGLLAAYGDDDDWKKREDWDRDSYWWFKIGDMAFRIPKPFEVGSIGTLAERTAELMMSEEMTGKRFGQRISDMVFNTFAMDPTPQFIKPFIDVYANKDSFSGRPIEGMADDRLRPQDRYSERTSEVARLLGSWGLPDPLRLAKGEYSSLSPKQIDFLLRGYFGWLATVATTATDAAVRPALGRGERPAMRMRDTFLAGNFVESLPTGSSRYVSVMYEQAKDVEQAWASYQAAVKSGDMEKAREIQQDEAPKLRNRMAVENAKRQIAELGQQAKRIESSRLMPAEEKRRRLDEIEARKHEAARRVASMS